MGQQVEQKWRPPLSWIVAAVLLGVLALPTAIVLWFYAISYPATRMGPVEIAAIGFAVVLTLIIGIVFSRTITGPINALIKTTEAIERGGARPVTPPDQHGTREIAALSQSFLDLAGRLHHLLLPPHRAAQPFSALTVPTHSGSSESARTFSASSVWTAPSNSNRQTPASSASII